MDQFRWDDVKVVLAVARQQTLSGAADQLGIDATTVGRRLAAFEQALGRRLFERTPDGVIATAVAQEMLQHAETMSSAADAMVGGLAGFETGIQGVVRLSLPPGVADFLVAPRLGALLQKHPKLRIELDSRIGYVDLARREADIALRAVRPKRGDLVSVRLTEATSVPAGSKEFVARHRKTKDASTIPFVTYEQSQAHIPDASWVLRVARPESLVLRTSSYSAQVGAARSGLCAMLVPDKMLNLMDDLEPLRLPAKTAKSLPAYPKGSLYLVAHRSMRNVPRVDAVWKHLCEMLDGSLND